MLNPLVIIPKFVIVALIVALLYVISVQSDIRNFEESALDSSRVRIEAISEGLKFFATKKKHYTSDYDSVLYVVENDTLLNQRNKLVKLTNQFLDKLNRVKKIPIINDFITIRTALTEIENILDEVNDSYRSIPEIADKNLQIYETVKHYNTSFDFPALILAMNYSDTLNHISIDVSDYSLQFAVQKSIDFISEMSENLSRAEVTQYTSEWQKIENLLYKLAELLKDPKQREQVFTNRYLKHTEIIARHMISIKKQNLKENINALKNESKNLTNLRDVFNTDYFSLTQNHGLKGLQKHEDLLISLNKNTIFAPPLERQEKLKFRLGILNNGFGYSVACPNDEGEFSRGVFNQRYKNYGNITNGEKSWEN